MKVHLKFAERMKFVVLSAAPQDNKGCSAGRVNAGQHVGSRLGVSGFNQFFDLIVETPVGFWIHSFFVKLFFVNMICFLDS